MRATVAEINLKNLQHNISEIRRHVKAGKKLCIAVKADAYGHGAVECAKTLEDAGVDYLAVATVDEGLELRSAGIKVPLLLLSLCQPEEAASAVSGDITPLVFDREYIRCFSDAAKKAGKKGYPVHLAVDSGMGRIGCYPEEAASLAQAVISDGALSLGGMCTHFAVSDSPEKEDELYTKKQYERFCAAIENVRQAGINPGLCHCCNSAATLEKPEYHLDMVRSGITAYGYYPDGKPRSYYEERGDALDLRPVMTLKTKIVSVRKLFKGMSVSYGHTWTASEDTTIGVLPIGYADGLFRKFASYLKAAVFAKDASFEAPVRGRICMDQCMIELKENASSGEKAEELRWRDVILFGDKTSGALVDAQDLADATGTISYEVTSAITKRVPRVYIR
ncbi:MAG: alanine racemase [Treponema sp.]|nr:alanine racemase [Treponema sp.]